MHDYCEGVRHTHTFVLFPHGHTHTELRYQNCSYLGDWILSRTVHHVMKRPLAADIVHSHKFQETCVNKTHANSVPNIHGCKVGHDGQR